MIIFTFSAISCSEILRDEMSWDGKALAPTKPAGFKAALGPTTPPPDVDEYGLRRLASMKLAPAQHEHNPRDFGPSDLPDCFASSPLSQCHLIPDQYMVGQRLQGRLNPLDSELKYVPTDKLLLLFYCAPRDHVQLMAANQLLSRGWCYMRVREASVQRFCAIFCYWLMAAIKNRT